LEKRIYLTLDFHTIAVHDFTSRNNTLITIYDELVKHLVFPGSVHFLTDVP
jgi:hypothetical protein